MDVTGLGYVGFESPNAKAWTEFGPEVLGMSLSPRTSGEDVYLKMDEKAYRLAIHQGQSDRLVYVGWELRDRVSFEAALGHLEAMGVPYEMGTEELESDRAVHAVAAFEDPAGYRHEIFYGHVFHPNSFLPGRPMSGFVAGERGIGHVVLAVPQITDELRSFATDVLGFTWYGSGVSKDASVFYRGKRSPRSHVVAYVEVPGHKGIHHVGMEVGSLDDVAIAQDLLEQRGMQVYMTLGRHTQGHYISFYATTPSGFVIEYMTGEPLIDDTTFIEMKPAAVSLWGHRRAEGLPGTVKRIDQGSAGA